MAARAAPESAFGQSEEGWEQICRICFAGAGEGGPEGCEGNPAAQQLISPCRCEGSQKHVHLGCLRRWQRAVQLGGSNHPDDRCSEDRHLICNVCKTSFDLPPQDRATLMAELAGVVTEAVSPGVLLVSTRTNSSYSGPADGAGLNLALRAYVEFKAAHFREAVYVLTQCRPSVGSTLGDGSDIVLGVNLSRRLQATAIPEPALLDGAASDAEMRTARQSGVEVVWMNGGPVEPRSVMALCHVSRLSPSVRAQLLEHTQSVWELASGSGDSGCEAVVCGAMSGVLRVAEEDIAEERRRDGGSSTTTVFAWAGFAQWTRSQLLGEMARGSWGWGRIVPPDVASSDTQALWSHLRYSDRLSWAPDNELARDFTRSLARAAPLATEEANPQADRVVAQLAEQLEQLHRGGPQQPRAAGGSPAARGRVASEGAGVASLPRRAAAAAGRATAVAASAAAVAGTTPQRRVSAPAEAASASAPERPSPGRRGSTGSSVVPSVQSCSVQ